MLKEIRTDAVSDIFHLTINGIQFISEFEKNINMNFNISTINQKRNFYMALNPSTIIGGASSTRSREKNDFYPTPEKASDAFFNKWMPPKEALVFEPCGGNGALIDSMKKNGINVVGSCDIDPRRNDIQKQDFLTLSSFPTKVDTVITNPPFNLAEEFVRKSFELGATNVAILIKATWFSASKRTDLFNTFKPSKKLDYTFRLDFMNKGSPVMECCWIVWEGKSSKATEYDLIPKI